jgi:Serine/threonine protein kinase
MGAVFMAERADGEFSQNVAIKLIKRGMDSDFIIRRFRHERQILASFEHPFIARLLDGGTTAEGIPYFVMEFIDGETLYDYCDKKRLGLGERLKIFQKICSALDYAHERQIIHRDIKPSNILINRFGSPKLLDFGIAKVLDPNLIHESVNPTASIMRMMTPDYASPEQIQGTDITPSSDIYSLGVLLYELLTGHKPYNFSGRALHEISRVICEVPSELPSRVVGFPEYVLPKYSGSEAFASVRGTTSEDLGLSLAGDLDNIIMKALSKNPADRYESVRGLSEDIARHLRGQEIVAGSFDADQSPASFQHLTPAANSRALAILPFRFLNLSSTGDTEDRFLGLGLADALISRLSKVRRFVVRPTSSVLSFADEPADPIKAGHDLKVDYVLDGNIKKVQNRLRVTVQLLNVADNAAVWAASIDEVITDVFALEDTLSNKLIEVLLPQLSGSELAEYAKRGTDVPEAFEHYLRGRYYFNTFTEEGLAKAFVSFHSAIAADPGYAHAYSGIADYYNWLGIIGVLPPQECFQPAIAAASKAIELDDELSEGHASLGFSLHAGNYDRKGAEYHLRRAIELNPGYANAYVWYSIVLYTEGRFTEGLEFARRSLDLDPLTPFNHHNVGWGLYYARRFDDAITQYEKVIADFPDYGFGYYGISKVHRFTGETNAAIKESDKAKELLNDSIFSLLAEAECYAADGRKSKAAEMLRQLEASAEKRYVSPYQLSLAYCYLGEIDNAFECLEEAVAIKEAWLNWMGVEPAFDILRSDPRFSKIWQPIAYSGADGVLFGREVRSTGFIESNTQIQAAAKVNDSLHDLTTLVIDTSDRRGENHDSHFFHSNYSKLFAALLLLFIAGGVFTLFRLGAASKPEPSATFAFQNPSIIVLPFKSDDSSADDLGVGLADALTNKLGNIKSLQVISASSGRAMASSDPSVIGSELGVTFVLRGRFHRSENGVNLSSELIRTSDNTQLWSQEFTAADGNLFRIQSDVAEKLWTSLGIDPLPLERQQILKSYTNSNAAYQLYLVGRYQMSSRTSEDIRKAIDTFEKSIKEDPAFALAYVGTADAYALLRLYDITPPADAYAKAQENTLKALAIDDNLAEAHATLGYLKFYHERDRNGSELEFRRAIQVNPSYAQAHHWFALALIGMNRPVEAITEARSAQRLDPRSLAIKSATGMAYFFGGQYNQAIEECNKALAIDDSFMPANKVKRWAYAATNDLAAARATFQKEMSYGGGKTTDPGWNVIEMQLTRESDDHQAALESLNRTVADPVIRDNHFAFAYEAALAYNALHETDKTFEWLEKADAAQAHGMNFLEVDPRLANLRNDPRFIKLVKRLNS